MHEARRFTDRDGLSWQVCELVAAVDAPEALADAEPVADGELYFFARGTTLVLRDYPRGWGELTWRELEALREGAQVLGEDARIRRPRRASALDSGGGIAAG